MEGIAENALFFLAGTLALAILLREGHVWWLARHTRRAQKAIRKLEEQHYKDMAQEAVREAERLLRETGRR